MLASQLQGAEERERLQAAMTSLNDVGATWEEQAFTRRGSGGLAVHCRHGAGHSKCVEQEDKTKRRCCLTPPGPLRQYVGPSVKSVCGHPCAEI